MSFYGKLNNRFLLRFLIKKHEFVFFSNILLFMEFLDFSGDLWEGPGERTPKFLFKNSRATWLRKLCNLNATSRSSKQQLFCRTAFQCFPKKSQKHWKKLCEQTESEQQLLCRATIFNASKQKNILNCCTSREIVECFFLQCFSCSV